MLRPSRIVFARKVLLSFGLGLASGYVDVVCLERYGCFGAMQTGNSVYAGAQLVRLGWREGVFYAAVMLSSVVGVGLKEHAIERNPRLLGTVAAPVVFMCVCGSDALSALGLGSRWLVCFISAAMGAQNTFTNQSQIGVNTTIITGSLQRLGLYLAKLAHGDLVDRKETEGTLLGLTVVVATVVGAIVGSLMLALFGDRWALVPPALLQATCKLAYVRWFIHEPPPLSVVPSLAATRRPSAEPHAILSVLAVEGKGDPAAPLLAGAGAGARLRDGDETSGAGPSRV
jgi:uncharacterized membrane protein YoaK (UPF0700 family)